MGISFDDYINQKRANEKKQANTKQTGLKFEDYVKQTQQPTQSSVPLSERTLNTPKEQLSGGGGRNLPRVQLPEPTSTEYTADPNKSGWANGWDYVGQKQQEVGQALQNSRVMNTLAGGVNTGNAGYVNAAGTLLDFAHRNAAWNVNPDEWAQYYEEAKAAPTLDAVNNIYGAADTMQNKGAQQIASAKDGLGWVGQRLVDAGVSGIQMAGDAVANTLLPGAGLTALGLRSFGSSAMDARNEGATTNQQMLYGLANAAVEVISEKIGDIPGIYGGGWVDDTISSVVSKWTSNPVLHRAAMVAASALGESLEEFAAGLVEPGLKTIYNKKGYLKNYTKEDWTEMRDAMFVGGLLGGIGGVNAQVIAPALMARQEATAEQQEAPDMTALPAPEQQSTPQAVEQSNPNSVVLPTAKENFTLPTQQDRGIIAQKEGTQNVEEQRGDVRNREGSERAVLDSTGQQTTGVEEAPGRTESEGRLSGTDEATARGTERETQEVQRNRINPTTAADAKDKAVSGVAIRTEDASKLVPGVKQGTEVNITKEDKTPAMKAARAVAKKSGAELYFFVGNNMETLDGDSARGAIISLDNGKFRILARADNPNATGEQINWHEHGHMAVFTGKLNVGKTVDALRNSSAVSSEAVDDIIRTYMLAQGIEPSEAGDYDEADVEELICDVLGKIDPFEGMGAFKQISDNFNAMRGVVLDQLDDDTRSWFDDNTETESTESSENTKATKNTAAEPAKARPPTEMVDGVSVTPDVAKVMESPAYEPPADYMKLSVGTRDAWKKNYLKQFNSNDAKRVARVVDMFTDKMIANDAIMGYVPIGSYKYDSKGPLRGNIEYIVTYDMDTSCPRTFQFLNYRDALQAFAGRPLEYNESINLLELMRAYGQQIPCAYCYVENKRALLSASYNNFFAFRQNVMNAETDEEALKQMYSYDAKKGKVSGAAQKVFDKWRANRSYNPDVSEVWTASQKSRNAVLNFLDSQQRSGKISDKTSTKAIMDMVQSHFGLSDKAALTEAASFVADWMYDTDAKIAHIYTIPNTAEATVDEKALSLHHEALAYSKSASSAKSVDNYVPYTDQLKNISKKDKAYINGMGGIRKHSSNDFRVDYVQDYLMFFADLAAGKWMGHTYTKNTDYVKIFGRTGDRINMSIAMYGDTMDTVRENLDEGMGWKDARELRKAYKNAGVMAMVTSDAQLSYALNADWVDMIIPFHASGLDKAVWYNLRMWQDYTSKQLERFLNADDMKTALKEKGVEIPKGAKAADIQALYEDTFNIKKIYAEDGTRVKPHFLPGDTYVNGQLVPGHHNDMKLYKKLCAEYGVHPRFDGVMVTDKNGKTINVIDHPNYDKLVKETARTDSEQGPIEFNFDEYDEYLGKTPLDYAMDRMEQEAKNGGYENTKEDPYGIVKEFKEQYLGKNRPLGYMTDRAKTYQAIRNEQQLDAQKKLNKELQEESEPVKINEEVRYSRKVTDEDLLKRLNQAEKDGIINFSDIKEGDKKGVVKVYRAMQAQPVDEGGNVIPNAAVQRIVSYDPLVVEAKVFTGTGKNKTSEVITAPAKLYSPMAGQYKGTWRSPIELGKWEMSEGHLERATTQIDKKTGKPKIDTDKKNASYGEVAYFYGLEKGGVDDNGKPLSDVPARYNPYSHTSLSALNDQFSSAEKRPELVTVESLVPVWHINNGSENERLPGAKDRVGAMSWHSGPTSSRLAKVGKPRTVILTRYDKPVRVVPDAEVAKSIADTIGDSKNIAIQGSTVTPSLAKELKAIGVDVLDADEWAQYAEEHPVKSFTNERNVRYSREVNMGTYFSGGGLVDYALRDVTNSTMAVEKDEKAAAVYELNNGEVYNGDVRDFSKTELDKLRGKVEYFHASPVCKNYSRMNIHRGEKADNDVDITTAEATAEAIDKLLPHVFTLEQVPGYNGSDALKIITDKLDELGYKWDTTIAKASDYGGATSRERLMLRAVRDGELPSKPAEAEGYSWYEATADIIDDMPDVDHVADYLQERIDNTPELKQALENATEPILVLGGTAGRKAWWAPASVPCPSITTKMADARVFMPDGTVKQATPRFFARVMGLPDSYKFTEWRGKENQSQAYKVIGNGVPVQLVQKFFGNLLNAKLNTGVAYSRESADSMADLRRQNEKLRERVEYWRGQTKETKEKTARQEDINKAAKELVKGYASTADVSEIASELKDLTDYIIQNNELSWTEVKDRAVDIAREIVQNSEELQEGDGETYADIKGTLKRPLVISARDASDVSSEWKSWRNANVGKVNVSINGVGTPVDTVYAQLNERYPSLFPDDITHPAAQLEQMVYVVDALAPIYANPFSYNMAEAIEYCANEIVDRAIIDIRETPPTFADKKAAELAAAKAEGARRVAEVRAQKNAKIEEIQRANKEAAKRAIARERANRDEKIRQLKEHQAEIRQRAKERKQEASDRKKLLAIARRLQAKTIDPATRAQLPEILKTLDTVAVNITQRGIDNLTGLRQWYHDKTTEGTDIYDPNFIPDKATLAKLDRLEKVQAGGSIGKMSIQQVRELTEVLQNIEHNMLEARKFQKSQLAIDNYQAGIRLINDIDNANPGGINRELSPLRAARRIAGYNDGAIEGTQESPIITLVKETIRGERDSRMYVREATHMLSKFLEDKKFMRRLYGRRADEITITGYDARTGEKKSVPITPAMRVSLYLHSLNDDNMRHVQQGGVLIPDMVLYKKGRLSEAYAKDVRLKLTKQNVASICAGMTQQERDFARALWRYFNEYAPKSLNEASMLLDGYEKFNVEDYFPISVDRNFIGQDYQQLVMDDKGSLTHPGFGEERVQSSKPIYLRDVNDVFRTAVQQNAAYATKAVPLSNLNKLINVQQIGATDSVSAALDRKFTAKVKSPVTASAKDYLSKYMRDYAGNTGAKKSGIDKLLAKIRSNYSQAVLTLAAGTAIKQAASYPTASAVVSTKSLSQALNPARTVDTSFIDDYTATFTQRTEGYSSVEQAELSQEGKHIPKVLNWIQKVDVATTKALKRAAAIEVQNTTNLKIGSEEYKQAVVDMYERIIEETQPNYSTALRPDLLRSDSALERALVMFATQPMQNFNILYDAVNDYGAKRKAYQNTNTNEAKKAYQSAGKKLGKAIGSQLASALVFALMQAGYDWFRKKDEKYRDEGEWDAETFAKATGLNMLTNSAGMLVGGKVLLEFGEVLADKISGQKIFGTNAYGFDVAELEAITDAVKQTANAVGAVSGAVRSLATGDEVDYEAVARKVWTAAEDALKLAGVPAENAATMVTSVAKHVMDASMGPYIGDYYALRIGSGTESSTDKAAYYDNLYQCWKKAPNKTTRELYDIMLQDGFTADGIKSAMENRAKKEQGVKSVDKLTKRWTLK